MELKLCDYNTCVLAKEKGFQELTSSYYRQNRVLLHNVKEDYHNEGYSFEKEDFYENWNRKNMVLTNEHLMAFGPTADGKYYHIVYSAPEQSLLQQWLRKKHNIHIESIFTMGFNYAFNIYKGLEIKKTTEVASYEEALEQALIVSLNLI